MQNFFGKEPARPPAQAVKIGHDGKSKPLVSRKKDMPVGTRAGTARAVKPVAVAAATVSQVFS